MSARRGKLDSTASSISTRQADLQPALSLSKGGDRRLDQDGAPARPLAATRALQGGRTARPLEDHHLYSGAAPLRHGRTDGARRRDERPPFLAYVKQVLLPTLSPGDIVV